MPCGTALPPRGGVRCLGAARRLLSSAGPRHLQDGGDGACVVGGELGVDGIGRGQQDTGAGQVAGIGVVLFGEHGVVRQAQLLGAFDFGIPVRAFDQAAHQPDAVLAGHADDVLHQLQRPRLVGLQGQAKALPLRAFGGHAPGQGLEHGERQLQPVHLFRVDGEVDVGPRGLLAQAPDAGHQLVEHAGGLRVFVARMQGAELDGYAIIFGQCASCI